MSLPAGGVAALALAWGTVTASPFGPERVIFEARPPYAYEFSTHAQDGRTTWVAATVIGPTAETPLNNIVCYRSEDGGASWRGPHLVLPQATPASTRGVIGTRLAVRDGRAGLVWFERIEDPKGGWPAYEVRSTVRTDDGPWTLDVPVAPRSAFGGAAQPRAFLATETGFIAIVTALEEPHTRASVTAYELAKPWLSWRHGTTMPDSAFRLSSVDLDGGSDGEIRLTIGTRSDVVIYRRHGAGDWRVESRSEFSTRAHDVEFVRSPSGVAALAWVDLRIPSLGHVAVSPSYPVGDWIEGPPFVPDRFRGYYEPRVAAVGDSTIHLLLHSTQDFVNDELDIEHFTSTNGVSWEATGFVNDPATQVRRLTGADVLGGSALSVLWDDTGDGSRGIRYRTTAPSPLVARSPEPFPIVVLPNPTRFGGQLSFRAPATGEATARLFDSTGRLALSWPLGPVVEATYFRSWAARSADGRALPSGVYHWRLEVATEDTVLVGTARSVILR